MRDSRHYVGYTLVDITPTGVIRDNVNDHLERNQHRNWETVLQCIGLITQPDIKSWRTITTSDISDYEFGELYNTAKLHKIWEFSFTVDHADIFRLDTDPVGQMSYCFDEVPVITGLTESARFILPVFHTSGAIKNIYFKFTHDLGK